MIAKALPTAYLVFSLVAMPGLDAVAQVPPGDNYGDAIRWYDQAARAGDADAQFLLAFRLETGVQGAQDLAGAVEWYGRAAAQGHAEAQFKLGTFYQQGRGVARDDATAFGWFRAAAEGGLEAAQYNLAVAYLNGSGVAADPVEALAWLELAATDGLPAAAGLRTKLGEALGEADLATARARVAALRRQLTGR